MVSFENLTIGSGKVVTRGYFTKQNPNDAQMISECDDKNNHFQCDKKLSGLWHNICFVDCCPLAACGSQRVINVPFITLSTFSSFIRGTAEYCCQYSKTYSW